MALVAQAGETASSDKEFVIEIATFRLKAGVTAAELNPIDKQMEAQYVAKQPGFVS